MLTDIDGAIEQTFALELAEGVGEFHLAGEVVLVVEAAAAQAAAADEAFGEGVGLVPRVPEELAGIAVHVVVFQHRGWVAERRIDLARIDAEARVADALPIAQADLELRLEHRRQRNGVSARQLVGLLRPGAGGQEGGRAHSENQALAHGMPASA